MTLRLLALLVLLTGCSFDLGVGDIPCERDEFCPSNAYCGNIGADGLGVCIEGTRPVDDDDATSDDDDSALNDDDSALNDDDSATDDDDSVDVGGSVFITEIFMQPGGDNPNDHQWIELTNTSASDVDLSDWTVAIFDGGEEPWMEWRIGDGLVDPVVIEAGGRVILAGGVEAANDAGVPNVVAVWDEKLNFTAAADEVEEVHLLKPDKDAPPVSVVDREAVLPVSEASASLSADPACFGPEPYDPQACWCVSPSGRWGGDASGYGTPGELNDECPAPVATGEFVFSELMLNTENGSPEGQWVEVHNAGPYTRSLFGFSLQIGSLVDGSVFTGGPAIGAGEYALIGNSEAFDDAAELGDQYDAEHTIQVGGDQLMLIRDFGGANEVIDEVDTTPSGWENRFSGLPAGIAMSLAPAGTAITNDFAAMWCASTAGPYASSTQHGSPGSMNPECGPQGDDDDATSDDDDATSDDDDSSAKDDDDATSDDDDATSDDDDDATSDDDDSFPDDDDSFPDDDDSFPDDDDSFPDDDDSFPDDDDSFPDDDDSFPDDDDDTPPPADYGGLIITEVMLDPVGTDTYREWFEIQNTSANTIDVQGLEIETGWASSSVPASLLIGPGERLVFGQSGDFNINGGVAIDVVYPTTIDLEQDTELCLMDAANVVDCVAFNYDDFPVVEGASLTLDSLFFNAGDNDQGDNWCISPSESFGWLSDGSTQYGDPGVHNSSCPESLWAGAVLFSEFQLLPAHGDPEGEWFELYNTGAQKVSLYGWEFVRPGNSNNPTTQTHIVNQGVLLRPSDTVIVAWGETATAVGGFVPDYSHGGDIDLYEEEDSLQVFDLEGQQHDGVSWWPQAGWPDATSADGATMSLDIDSSNESDNDFASAWCLSEGSTYGAGGNGTPNEVNSNCSWVSPCDDVAGQLIITEVMANSELGYDGQWVEVYNPNGWAVSLDDYEVSDGPTASQLNETGVFVPAEGYALLAYNGDPTANGGLAADATYGPGVTQFNASSTYVSLNQVDTFVCTADSVSAVEAYDLSEHRSWQLDPVFQSDVSNDFAAAWCAAPSNSAFGSSADEGTPGAANLYCNEYWWDGPSFCVAGESLEDVSTGGEFSETWTSARSPGALWLAPDYNANNGQLDLYAAGTNGGNCDEYTSWGPVLLASVPPSSGTLNLSNLPEFSLAASPYDLTFEGASMTVHFDETSLKLIDFSITGSARVESLDGSYCTDHPGACFDCPDSSPQQCATVELGGLSAGGEPMPI